MSSPRTASRCARAGTHPVGRCPFHEDGHPSFAVYPETRSFCCFVCRAGGDGIDFVRRADTELPRRSRAPEQRPAAAAAQPNPPEPLSLDDRMVLTAATAVYHEMLLRSPNAIQ